MHNPKKFNLKYIKLNTDLTKTKLKQKKSVDVIVKPTSDFMSRASLIHEVDWTNCELEKIPEAASTTIEELLPEKAKYDYTFSLSIPEQYLQYLNFDVLAKTVPEQNITGVQEFDFTSLREVMIDVYKWNGITQIVGIYHDNDIPETPPGTYTRIQTLIQENPNLWYVKIDFAVEKDYDYFGVPDGELPPGPTTPYGTVAYPTQYWEGIGSKSFTDFYIHFGDYDDAVNNINQYYSHVSITPKDDGPPWHSYISATNNETVIADKQVIINKLDTDFFQIKITGYFLLLSKAVTETSWSDPVFPTYEPQGDDMQTSLRVYLDPTLQTITYENYIF